MTTTQTSPPEIRKRRLNVDEFFRLGEIGVLRPDERTELLDGEMYVRGAGERRRLTVDELFMMVEAGILQEDDRIELIDGEMIEMSPIGKRHHWAVLLLNRIFSAQAGARYWVSVQGPLTGGESLYLEPDLMILRGAPPTIENPPTRPADVLLLVEVAESTLARDRDLKLPVYARLGIPEVWFVDLRASEVVVYREPRADGYAVATRHGRGGRIVASLAPEIALNLDDLFGD